MLGSGGGKILVYTSNSEVIIMEGNLVMVIEVWTMAVNNGYDNKWRNKQNVTIKVPPN